jgi:hypothetical protein
MALVPRDDALPLPKPTAQMIPQTTRQPTKIEYEGCINCHLPATVETHPWSQRSSSPLSQSTMLTPPFEGQAMARFHNILTAGVTSL